jgi:hypothetical protein
MRAIFTFSIQDSRRIKKCVKDNFIQIVGKTQKVLKGAAPGTVSVRSFLYARIRISISSKPAYGDPYQINGTILS